MRYIALTLLMVFSFMVGFLVAKATYIAKVHRHDVALLMCERELPRNQHCEIIARVKEKK